MTHDRDDVADATLDGVDLHAWRVPPPAAIDRPSLVLRALSPAATAVRRPRIAWLLAAMVLLNAVIAAVLVIVLAPQTVSAPAATVQPAGGSSVDARVRKLLRRLDREQRELERRLAEIEQLRALVTELTDKVRRLEAQDGVRERTVAKRREPRTSDREGSSVNPFEHDRDDPEHVDPFDPPQRDAAGSCDVVSCVLNDYQGACCAKLNAPPSSGTAQNPSVGPSEVLGRQAITAGIESVRSRIDACADRSPAKGKIRLRVRVAPSGRVTDVTVEVAPDAALGRCVAAAVKRARFERTQRGGSFSYPFMF